jgi:SAM-dependent methyltransferase
VGVDISAPVVEAARRRVASTAWTAIIVGDVQTHVFEPAAFDAAFSRFGVMFFADPTAAFGNIRRALRPGGRLAFVCWRCLDENELDFLPLRAAAPHLPPDALAAPAVEAFSFAEPNTIERVLAGAGFDAIRSPPMTSRSGAAAFSPCCRCACGSAPWAGSFARTRNMSRPPGRLSARRSPRRMGRRARCSTPRPGS